MPPIPSGPDAQHPTRILGDNRKPPDLWGAERPWFVINLDSNPDIGAYEWRVEAGRIFLSLLLR